jgi:hypothetical protein
LAIEFALGTIIWIAEFRTTALLLGIAMHLVFEVTMNLQFFGWMMIACLTLFV